MKLFKKIHFQILYAFFQLYARLVAFIYFLALYFLTIHALN